MKPVCRVVRVVAPSAGDGALSSRLESHIDSCLACQAELARYGKLRRQLAAMADVVVAAPEPIAAAVAAAIAGGVVAVPNSVPDTTGRIAAAAGAVVAAAAGAAAVAIWRHTRPATR